MQAPGTERGHSARRVVALPRQTAVKQRVGPFSGANETGNRFAGSRAAQWRTAGVTMVGLALHGLSVSDRTQFLSCGHRAWWWWWCGGGQQRFRCLWGLSDIVLAVSDIVLATHVICVSSQKLSYESLPRARSRKRKHMTTRASSMLALFFFMSLGALARAQIAGTWVMTGMPMEGYMGGSLLHDEFTQLENHGTTQNGKGWGTSTWPDPRKGAKNYNYTTSINVTDVACATDYKTNETTYRAKYSWTQDFGVGHVPTQSRNWSSGYYKVWCAYHSYDSKAEIMTMQIWHEPHSIYGTFRKPGVCPATKGFPSWMPDPSRQTDTLTYRCVEGCQLWSWKS
jgi:hypothetical protein